jgi:SAM-dependent MidA family methyltransferase
MSWIVDEIEGRGGAVPFEAFMELALYHPEYGYYSAEEPRYGRGGDYLTAPTASEWYPRMIARSLAGMAAVCGALRLIDLASGDGSLIAGVVEALGQGVGEVLCEILSVERSEAMRGRQRDQLAPVDVTVRWVGGAEEVGSSPRPTVVHASELYDAQPVVRVTRRSGKLRELWVTLRDGELDWLERPPRSEVEAYFTRHGVELEDGQIAEANLASENFHRGLLESVGEDGLCLVLDYGYEARRLYDPRGRRGGSLTTFRRHQLGHDPFAAPGETDLTAHVNWDDLRRAGESARWAEVGLWPLAEYLVRAGIEEELAERGLGMEAELDAATITARQEIKRLLDPEGMGSDLKVLVQAKGALLEAAHQVFSFKF